MLVPTYPDLANKVAVVTGGSRGISRAIAQRLAKDGALVAVHYGSNAEAAALTVSEIEANGGNAFAVQAEVSSVSSTPIATQDTPVRQQTSAGNRSQGGFGLITANAMATPRFSKDQLVCFIGGRGTIKNYQLDSRS